MQHVTDFLASHPALPAFALSMAGLYLGSSLSIVVHETGHYFAALALGIPIERVVVDHAGPKLSAEWRGTTFEFRPLYVPGRGGYVALKGETLVTTPLRLALLYAAGPAICIAPGALMLSVALASGSSWLFGFAMAFLVHLGQLVPLGNSDGAMLLSLARTGLVPGAEKVDPEPTT